MVRTRMLIETTLFKMGGKSNPEVLQATPENLYIEWKGDSFKLQSLVVDAYIPNPKDKVVRSARSSRLP